MTLHLSTLHGPTLDPADVFARNLFLPELEVGDWLFMENMGDYHNDGASKFCGFGWRKIYYYVSVERRYTVDLMSQLLVWAYLRHRLCFFSVMTGAC